MIIPHLFAFPLSCAAVHAAITLQEGFGGEGRAGGRRWSGIRRVWILL